MFGGFFYYKNNFAIHFWITVCKPLGKVIMFSSQICSCPITVMYIFNTILAAKDEADAEWQ